MVAVEVQIPHQLVAGADAVGAAHAPRFGAVPVGEGYVVIGISAPRLGAVAVQVISDGVQLGQGGDVNQAVVVRVVVGGGAAALGLQGVAAVVEYGILAAGAEVPRVIAAGDAVQVGGVPVVERVGAGRAVISGGLHLGGG